MRSIVKNNRLYYSNQKGKYGTRKFNCWGSTAFVLGIRDRLYWLGMYEMEAILEEYTDVIEETDIQRGDILTIYDQGGLTHTAIYLGRGRYFQKKGGNNSEITDIGGVFEIYGDYQVEYRRVVKITT